ncbi:MAG: hypothetical protein MI810_17660 [Flavobacteriales bacterium]|nr:hypothetical protein [Flavobacteriales bacterium]
MLTNLTNSQPKLFGWSYSLITIILLTIFSLGVRMHYTQLQKGKLEVTTWDALGYYAYLPGTFIHKDISKMDWLVEKEKEYNLSGGDFYQFQKLPNGNRVGKYFIGVSIMELPFFLTAHLYASTSDKYEADGFSAPYQYSLAYGVLLYFVLSLILLRKILLRYYNEIVTSITLIILVLGTNLIQYTSVDSGFCHSFIFFLYVLVIHFTIKWHEFPTKGKAILIGIIIGFSIICRPTEVLMIFIPLFWGVYDGVSFRKKWALIRRYRSHIFLAILFCFIVILPQLFYWKWVSGVWIYNVGSKWQFLDPWFRVLFGFEKGWFIYTPLTLLMIAGFFFMKNKEFKGTVLSFGLLNIWLIISWHDWRYGGTYSNRALVQSYPLLALPLGAIVSSINKTFLKSSFYPILVYFLFVNLFQIWQYNRGILLNDGMNLQYYSAIYLNPNPTLQDFSLLDTKEHLEKSKVKESLLYLGFKEIQCTKKSSSLLYLKDYASLPQKERWLQVETTIQSYKGFCSSFLCFGFANHSTRKTTSIRLNRPLAKAEHPNSYTFHYKVPSGLGQGKLYCFLKTNRQFEGNISKLRIFELE